MFYFWKGVNELIPLRIIDMDFNFLGELDQYESLQMEISYSAIGKAELVVNRYVQYADQLQMDHIIFPFNRLDRAFIIRNREIELDEEGKATENWKITTYSLKSFATQRLIYPLTNQTHNVIKGSIEDVLHHYVNTEMINPEDHNRKFENLILGENSHRGAIIEKKIRFDGLAETLENISANTDIGWNIVLDLNNKKFVFVTTMATDRSYNQQQVPAVLFSTDFDTLATLSFSESKLDYKNVVVCAGQGEGVNRSIVTVGEASGQKRFEVFVDARDISNDDEDIAKPPATIEKELTQRAQEKLEEYKQTVFLEGQALDNQSQKFERDYYIGDIVTVKDRGWGVTIDTRITGAKIVVERGKYSIDLTYDNDRPTLISKIKKDLATVKNELQK